MSQTTAIKLEKPLSTVELLDENDIESSLKSSQEQRTRQLLELQKETLSEVCRTLQNAAAKVKEFQENIFKEYKEQIAKLSVEIARKVLIQKVQEGDYKIETIIKEALKDSPSHQNVILHLNPDDFAQYQDIQKEQASHSSEGIDFIADSAVGPAECILESPKGILKLSIEENLERIAKAFEKVE